MQEIDFNFGDLQVENIPVVDVQVLDTSIRKVDPENEKYIELVEDLRRGAPVGNPIWVKKCIDLETGLETYELADGGHRLAASKEVGNDTIPAFVLPEDTPRHIMLAIQVRNNRLRIKQLPTQEAAQAQRLMSECDGLTIAQLAQLMGYSESGIRNLLKLSSEKLEENVINLVEQGTITVDNARELAKAGKALQTPDLIQAAQTLKPAELKERISSTKKALSAGQTPEAKPKEPKKFEPKFKVRDRALIEGEIESGSLAQAKFDNPELQDAFLEGVRWAVSLDEDTVTLAREEFDRKQAEAEQLKKEKELAKQQKRLEELKADLEINEEEQESVAS